MYPSENTGIHAEHYNLIRVLYHALHGAEDCNTYGLDAEAAGDEQLTVSFRCASRPGSRASASSVVTLLGYLERA